MSTIDKFLDEYKLTSNKTTNELIELIYETNINNISSCFKKLLSAIESLSNKIKGRYKKNIYKNLYEDPGNLKKLVNELTFGNRINNTNTTKINSEIQKINDVIKNLDSNPNMTYIINLCNYNSDVYKKLVKKRRIFKLGSKTILSDNNKFGLPHLLGGITNSIKMMKNKIFHQYLQSFDLLKDTISENTKDINDYIIYSLVIEKDPEKFIDLLKQLDSKAKEIDIIQNFTSTTKRKLRNNVNKAYQKGGHVEEQDGGFIDKLFTGNKTDKDIRLNSNKKKRFKLRKKIVKKNYKIIKKIFLFFFQFIIIKLFFFTYELIQKISNLSRLGLSGRNIILSDILFVKDPTTHSKVLGTRLLKSLIS